MKTLTTQANLEFSRAILSFGDELLRAAQAVLGDFHLAEDAVAQAYLKAWGKRRSLRDPALWLDTTLSCNYSEYNGLRNLLSGPGRIIARRPWTTAVQPHWRLNSSLSMAYDQVRVWASHPAAEGAGPRPGRLPPGRADVQWRSGLTAIGKTHSSTGC